ncbi:hypothetical protein QNI16_36805 [Cytophagaceae bacterium YF14B1]|uniref:Fibronectin type-III domain-containing protein n=1 Tax=Xanthocytophaga flava TaxID=3048013 RepID=A0AAE3QZK4_9BACT|nr:hypothetical protein [Xanthocytophaga flavus]MDJ1486101.1 hypothetical protein [Xanthocytophaga flavus]
MFLCLILSACDQLLEPSLTEKTPILLSPTDSVKLTETEATFWWESMQGATNYQLQVVSGSFGAVSKLWADTLVSTNKFTLELQPGHYSWRVQARNLSSQSEFTQSSFQIDTTSGK